ncbi:MAG: hypothetical protein ACXU7Z_01845 [Burkholderiaceae bacterium]
MTHRSAVQSNTPREPIATAAEEKGEVVSSETTAIDADDNSDNAQTDTSLPSVELTDDLLFKILKSEIAYQRGEWQDAYITLLAVAQQTRDPRIARRAVEVALSAKRLTRHWLQYGCGMNWLRRRKKQHSITSDLSCWVTI